jgi:uncharacterized protein YjbJ (UPF0337 family)
VGIPATPFRFNEAANGFDRRWKKSRFHQEETPMNWDRIEGNWKQMKGNVKQQWGKLTDDQLDVIAGKRDELAGKIQETYGISKDEAEKQVSAWQKQQKELDRPRK